MFAIHIKARRMFKRYSLEIIFFTLVLVLGFSVGKAFASEPQDTKFLNQKPEQYIVARPAITTTTSTTTLPIVKKKVVQPAVIQEPSQVAAPLPAGSHADWLREAGVPEDQLGNAEWLVNHENGMWCPTRGIGQTYCPEVPGNTSKAYGIPQALPGSKMVTAGEDWATNPITQLRWMNGYVNQRYGGWAQACEKWKSRAHFEKGEWRGGWY